MARLKNWECFLLIVRILAILYSLVIVAAWIHLVRTEHKATFPGLMYGVPLIAVGYTLPLPHW